MQFLYHNVLLLMLIPIILLMFLVVTNKDKFQKYFSQESLRKLSISNRNMNKVTRNILLFIALMLMTIALARPVANEKEQNFKQEVASIVVAIDVSKSMLATDISPNRLSFAKQKLLHLIDLSKKNALAVILFAKSSFMLSPVTQDYKSLRILVENLNTGSDFDNGSNIYSTLETTNKLLKDYKNKNLILLTDGGNKSDFSSEIEYANKNNINVYTIAMATKKEAPIKLDDGNFLTKKDGSIVTVSLNEDIKKLSLNTNGGYIEFSTSNDDIKQILSDIDARSAKKELESKKFKTYTELFYYPLGLALFLLLIAFSSLPNFKRKGAANLFLVAFCFSFLNSSAKAFEFDFENIDKANKYYKEGDYKKAIKEYEKVANTPEARYNLANSYYKNGQYKKALVAYKNVVSSKKDLEYKKLHNLGNTYVKLNDLQSAKQAYENALKIKENQDTRDNLKKVLEALKKQNKSQKNQDNKNSQNNKDKKDNKDNKSNKNNKDKNQQQNSQSKNSDKNKNQEKNQNRSKEQNSSKDEKNSKQEQQKSSKEKLKQQNGSKEKEQKSKNQNQKSQMQSGQNRKFDEKSISNMEERKWIKEIQQEKTPVLLHKVPTKGDEENSSTPW